MQTVDAYLLPKGVQEQISNVYPHLSKNGKTALLSLLKDGGSLLEGGLKQALDNNSDFEKKLSRFLLNKRKNIINNMEKEEREKELSINI